MHSEHLQNVRPGLVFGGWLVAVAVTSLILMAFAATGLLTPEEPEPGLVPSLVAVVIGFFLGGLFAGFRSVAAPVLHAAAIGLTSLLVWFAVNTVMYGVLPGLRWEALSMTLTVAVLFAQTVSAMVGALIGFNLAVRGRVSLSEELPEG
jgi:hypothetical protein